jgi:Glycosyltransferase family 87
MKDWKDRLRLLFVGALLSIAGSNVVAGFWWLFMPEGGGDLYMRWQEQQYVLRHKNPFDVYAASVAEPNQPESPLVLEPDLGQPKPGYPPWAYGTGISFMWSRDIFVVRLCFAAVNLLFLGCIAAWNFWLGGSRWEVAFVLMAVSLSADSMCNTLAIGQLGVIVVGSLVAACWCDERDRPILAGLLLGVALIKPTLSFPFLLPFLLKRRWLTLVIAGVYTALASAIVWALVGTDPITMLEQMQTAAADWGTIYYTTKVVPIDWSTLARAGKIDPNAILVHFGVSPKAALQISPVICLTIAFVLMWFWRRASMMTLFAIAAVTARLWVGHGHYDDVILLFVGFGLAEALVRRFSARVAFAYGILGFSLLFPRFFHIGLIWDHLSWRLGPVWECVLLLCQLGCLVVLLANSPRKPASSGQS